MYSANGGKAVKRGLIEIGAELRTQKSLFV